MTTTLHLDTHHHAGPVDPRVFGGFAEHLGRCVYEGMYDPGNAHGLVDADGFRTDVIAALRPLAMPVMRYPGGNFVSCYDWRDGIGPRDQRPVRTDYAWRSLESNRFGTDEFMVWAKRLGTEPMMAVNLGTAGTADAAALVEYCNLPRGSHWADRRPVDAPYGVKLWCLGNEMDGPWQAGHVPADVYAQRALSAANVMRGLDRSIQTVACGSSARTMATYLAYDRTVLEYAWDGVDYISAHRYSDNSRDDTPWYLAEGVEIDRVLADYAGLLDYVRGVKRSSKRVYVSFDEWNVWYRARHGRDVDGEWAHAPHLLEEWYDHQDALVCAQYLMAFLRRADLVKIACLAQIVNVIAPVMTRADGLLLQTIYHPIRMVRQRVPDGAVSLHVAVDGPTYRAGERGDVPAVDAAAVAFGDTVSVFLVNRSAEPVTVELALADRRTVGVRDAEVLAADPTDGNTWADPDRVRPVRLPHGDRPTLPPTSFAAITLATAGR